jgi:hypothetical protein
MDRISQISQIGSGSRIRYCRDPKSDPSAALSNCAEAWLAAAPGIEMA